MTDEIYLARLSAWAPGIGSSDEWDEWALGKRSISFDAKGPEIAFTDSLFRRRLSQISKMTVQVIHDLLPLEEDTKIIFLSFRGELSKQFQINKMLVEEVQLSPAVFSLSVFNTPVALASIAIGLKGGYTTIYPANDSFAAGIKTAQAALLCGMAEELVFVYADEQVPREYLRFYGECPPPPAAFGLLLSRRPESASIPFSTLKTEDDVPLDFLRQILLCKKNYAAA